MVVAFVVALLPGAGPASASGDAEAFINEVVQLTNFEREQAGVPPVVISTSLMRAAVEYATVLARGDCFQHTCGPAPDFALRAEEAGYTDWLNVGENIADGCETPRSVVDAWMASPLHRQNILNPEFNEIGVAYAVGANRARPYCNQVFGARWVP